ncbi:glycoside hydrolase, putative [Bodo saltans]|uniref:Glycoside hydrolase, putative n=1 Tax=Bodo saltans TaxID=75058 RepID=A0A0S4JN81_BODSA|nr:glycoside hydrolase, putative [Bodo saltans]|eukprot:CUG91614.1 glycoside hydrolase, putative [Bodo saltans]
MVVPGHNTTQAPHRSPGDLSREYNIPARPTFVLGAAHSAPTRLPPSPATESVFPSVAPQQDGDSTHQPHHDDEGWCIVQNPANTTYDVSPTVLDNIMGSTNGVLGVKHRSETQTAVCRSYVKMNRVYHNVPLTQELRSVALPKCDEVGGVICAVDINVCVNGEFCNLLEMTHRSLSMKDASYRSQCVISTFNGDLSFMMEYQRFTSLTRVSDWIASVKYSDFTFSDDHPAGYRMQLTAIAEIRVLKDHWHVHEGSTASSFMIESHSSHVEVASQSWAECAVYSATAPTATTVSSSSVFTSPHGGTSRPIPAATSPSGATGLTRRLVPPTVGADSYRRHNHKGPQEQFHGADHNFTVFSSTSDCDANAASSQEEEDTAAHNQQHYWIALRKFDVEVTKGAEPRAVEMTLVCRHSRPGEEAGRETPTSAGGVFDVVTDVHAHKVQLLTQQRALLNEFWDSFDMTVSEDEDAGANSTTSHDAAAASPTTASNSLTPRSPLPKDPESSTGRLTASLRYAAFTSFCAGAGAHHGIAANALSSPGIAMQLNLQHYLYHGTFYIFNAPRAAQRLMRHLVEMLPHARAHARRMSLTKGALFPHSTISGEECGSYFLTKSPRFHINADLAYVVFLYLEGVGDIIEQQERLDLLELLLEMGRVWLEIGEWQEHHTAFRIDEVSGPDEYGGLVDGNFYTFLAVKKQLNQTTQLVRRLLRNTQGATLEDFACVRESSAFFEDTTTLATTGTMVSNAASVPLCSHCLHAANVSGGVFGAGGGGTASTYPSAKQVREVLDRVEMSDEELLELQRAADAIVLPRDDRTGVYFAHEHFDTLKTWTGGDLSYPLYLNYHPLVVYRHKLCEIPEVLLGMLIYPSGFEQSDIQRNLMYYEPLCTHDTPESLAVIAATRFRAFGDTGKGLGPLEALAQLDLDNITYTAEEGLHLSAMSASWMAVVFGIGGLRVVDGSLHMSPSLPVGVDHANFTVQWRGAVVRVAISSKEVIYELLRGASFRLIHQDHTRVHLHEARANVFPEQRQVVIPRTLTQQMTAHFDGVIFTIESLVENLLDINFEAWSRVLNTYFENESHARGVHIKPFTIAEYIQVMVYQEETGSANFSGLQKVLASRDMNLELGNASDMELVVTRYGLANAKVEELRELLRERELRLVPGVLDLLMDLKSLGLRVALVSYTRSMYDALHQLPHAVSELFTTMIDGTEARGKRLRGRPHTDLFLRAAKKMHVPAERCIVCASQLDRGYKVEDLKEFLMFLDVEEPRSAELRLQSSGNAAMSSSGNGARSSTWMDIGSPNSGSHYVMKIGRGKMPRSTAELEDAILAASTRRTNSNRTLRQ